MHSPVLWPVQGMPSTAGRSGLPGMLLNVASEFGTVCGHADAGVQVFLFAARALGQRHRGAGNCEDGDRRGCGNRDRKSAGKDQSSC